MEDRPDHRKEIQTPIHFDILTFLHMGPVFTENFNDFTIFIFVLSLITCTLVLGTTGRSTDIGI
jgi:hypothetical protein